MPYLADIKVVKEEADANKLLAEGQKKYFGESQQCVAAVKHFAGAPETSLWKAGEKVKESTTIKPGTAIATFDANGRYKGHAAIYDTQDRTALYVYDQWEGTPFHSRPIYFRGYGRASNDGDQYYVIERK